MGSGYRTFTAGEVLTASNVQNYLMDQSVMSFADSTARATGIGTANFEEGMLSYLADTNQLEVYDGAAWSQIGQTPGLVLLNTTSFSGVSSQSVNDVFSATYTNYKILIDTDATDADTALNMRMRVSGTDNSSSNYRWSSGYVAMTGSSTIAGQNGAGLGTSFRVLAISSSGRNVSSLDFFNPFATEETQYLGNYQQIASNQFGQFVSGNTSVTTSYTGFTLLAGAGTMTGTVSVYGYNK